jgi:hypothetical protein
MRCSKEKAEAAAEEAKEKTFDRTRDPAWAKAVDSWQWTRRDDETSWKTGACQRCGHTIAFVDATAVYSGFRVSAMESVEDAGRRYATCNCGVKHPEAPDGEGGCGANGLINRG